MDTWGDVAWRHMVELTGTSGCPDPECEICKMILIHTEKWLNRTPYKPKEEGK
jgi:hypothetical protein